MRLTLLTREDCELCDQLQAELAALGLQCELPPLELCDVDSDPGLRRRWGLKVPVLLLDGQLVCHGRLDAGALQRLLARGGAPPG